MKNKMVAMFCSVRVRVLAASCLALCVAGCADDKHDEAAGKSRVFIMGVNDGVPPMGYRNASGEIVGYDIDLAREVTTRLGYELKLEPIVAWNRKEEMLHNGEIDCIWASFTITPKRAETILFTPPYLENFQALLVRTDKGYKSTDDLQGATVGVQIDSSGEAAFKTDTALSAQFPDVKRYVRYDEMAKALESGEIDVLVVDTVFAIDSIQYQKKPFRIIGKVLAVEEYGIGFRPGDAALRDAVWATLKEMQKDGTVSNISRKWFEQDLSVIK